VIGLAGVISIAAYHPAFVIDPVQVGVGCFGIINWIDQCTVGITEEAMASCVIGIRADNLIEIVHASYGGKETGEGKKGHISSDAYVRVKEVGAVKVCRAGKVASIVQGPEVGIGRTGYNEIGVGGTGEKKPSLIGSPLGRPK